MKTTNWLALSLAGIFLLTVSACSKDTESKEPSDSKANAKTNTKTDTKTDKPDSVGSARAMPKGIIAGKGNDPSYDLKLDVPKTVSFGDEAVVRVSVIPTKGWKMNMEFPTRLTITPPEGVSVVGKDKQLIGDAERFDDEAATFAIKFKADSGGQKSFQADFRFAVCTDATCDPKKEELVWVVDIQ